LSARNTASVLRIVALYPALLGTYGDGGNLIILTKRAQWRSLPVEVTSVEVGEVVPDSGDIYLIGGGEDGAQLAVMAALAGSGPGPSSLARAFDCGAQMLAVCAGLQLLGSSFTDARGAQTAGLGLIDITTGRLATRAVGELLADPDPSLGLPSLSGFENHGGHTVLGEGLQPLALVRAGTGNGPDPTGRQAGEGVLTESVIATYLHGPVLARNPALADLLLERATGAPLPPLDVPEHAALRARVGADG
jgi:CobQ-like glutamine amidotransferase family enzyme